LVIKAKALRDSKALLKVSGDRPGWYRWWAKEEEVRTLLNSRFLMCKYFDKFAAKLHKGEGDLQNYYYIYTGIAVKESIRKRLDWHINQRHTEGAVQHGTLSTLRQSLSSLIAGDQYNEFETNDFIDKLMVEYIPVEYQIKSEEAKKFLEKNEEDEMNKYVLILNIKDNMRREIQCFKRELSQLRGRSKKRTQKGN
jgi:hypothetical protein